MIKRQSLIPAFALVFILSASACSRALPKTDPSFELARVARMSEESAVAARVHAEETRRETERAEQILREIRELVKSAQAAELRCQKLVKKIPKRVYRRPRTTTGATSSNSGKSAEKKREEKSFQEYSESDRPVKKK